MQQNKYKYNTLYYLPLFCKWKTMFSSLCMFLKNTKYKFSKHIKIAMNCTLTYYVIFLMHSEIFSAEMFY